MKDRFRFRAFDKQDKELIYEAENTYDCQSYNGHTIWHDTFACLLDDEERYIVEQCTGLKDENGTLIYEGDIVECFYDHFDGNFTEIKVIGVVKWGVGEWSVQNEKKEDWYFLSYANYDEKHLQSDSVKVIGNIHENPELLEGE